MNGHSFIPRPLRTWHWTGLVAVLIVALGLIWYVGLAIGIYALGWQGQKTTMAVRLTPLPAAFVQGHVLWMADYFDQRVAVERYSAYLTASTTGAYQAPSAQETPALTLTTMIKTQMLQQLAHRAGVVLTSADVDQAYQAQLLQNGNAAEVATTIKQLYGWTPEQFKAHVISTAVLRDKVQEYLSFDVQRSASAKQQATSVLDILRTGKDDFATVAKKYSQDAYGINGGDLGFVNKGEQAKEIDDAAFSLEINQVSDLIHTKFGYHILKPVERKTVDGVDQVHLLLITILAPSVDTFVNDALHTSRVIVFAHSLRWDSQNTKVTRQP